MNYGNFGHFLIVRTSSDQHPRKQSHVQSRPAVAMRRLRPNTSVVHSRRPSSLLLGHADPLVVRKSTMPVVIIYVKILRWRHVLRRVAAASDCRSLGQQWRLVRTFSVCSYAAVFFRRCQLLVCCLKTIIKVRETTGEVLFLTF